MTKPDPQDRFVFERDPANGMLVGPDGAHYRTEAAALYYELGFCGCGRPDELHAFLIECAKQFETPNNGGGRHKGLERLVAAETEMVAELIAHLLSAHNLTEHGSSVYFSWLTPRGRQFIETGSDHGDEP